MSTSAVEAVKTLVHVLLTQLGRAAAGPGDLREGMVDTPSDTRVAQLHADLTELGFHLAPVQSGRFDQYTRWTVRDFQSYAKFAVVAQTSTPFGYLAEPVTEASTDLVVDDPLPFALLTVPFVVRAGTEDLEVTARTLGGGVPRETWTVSRARDGTDATSHPVGEGVSHLPEPRYSSTLTSVPVPAGDRFAGPVSGVVNQRTADLIRLWKERRYRCPVVVEAWTIAGRNPGSPNAIWVIPATAPGVVPARAARLADNIWRPEEISVVPRVFVRDFSDYWQPRPPGRPVDGSHRNAMTVLGSLNGSLDHGFRVEGPATGPDAIQGFTSWSESEVLPEALLGSDLATLVGDVAAGQAGAAGRLSTFKVVRAGSEVECLGFFDSVQGYDTAFLSRGLCHWTAGQRDPSRPAALPRDMWIVLDGEFWAFLAFLRTRFPRTFDEIATHWGLGVTPAWIGDGQQPGGPWVPGERKYVGRATLTSALGAPQQLNGFPAAGPGAQPYGQYGDHQMFRLWHVFYRFVMAGRTSANLRLAEWIFARTRIRDILATPWGLPPPPPPPAPDPAFPLPAGTTIGDVFTSERTVAMLYRWHILNPATLLERVRGSARADSALHGIVTAAAAQLHAGSPGQPPLPSAFGQNTHAWGDDEESALRDRILAAHPPGQDMGDTLRVVDRWPGWGGIGANTRHYTLPLAVLPAAHVGLSLARDSFNLDDSNLP
jgi:hypothetical protein